MEERTFTFHISPYDVKNLTPQLSVALEKRSALLSRERYPQLWSVTDKLNAQNEARNYKPMLSRGKSILFLILGIILVVPGIYSLRAFLILASVAVSTALVLSSKIRIFGFLSNALAIQSLCC